MRKVEEITHKPVKKKYRYKNPQFVLHWPMEVKAGMEVLRKDYDAPSMNDAIVRACKLALKEWYLPGYERREKPVKEESIIVENKLAKNPLISPS